MPVTIQDLARELNISHTTVSRVLNNRNSEFISAATRERVWEAASRLGYRPHLAARALVTGRTLQIALLMRYLYSAFHARVVHEVQGRVRQAGYQLMIATLDPHAPELTLPLEGQVDGFLAFEVGGRAAALLRPANSGPPPLVALGGRDLGDGDCVGFDLAAGTAEALSHLEEIGCRRIAYVGEDKHDPRRTCYEEKMRAAGRTPERVLVSSQRRGEVREAVAMYLNAHGVPDGFHCFNDEVALGVYRALRDRGVRIPQDAAIVGCDGIEEAAYVDTPLTTIELPIAGMCEQAWQTLHQRLNGADVPTQRTLLLPRLVVRASTQR